MNGRCLDYLLIAIYAAQAIRWSYRHEVGLSLYWLGALAIMVAITFFWGAK